MHLRLALASAVALPCLLSATSHAALVAHYNFNSASGTTAIDSVGGVNGTLQGGASFVTDGVAGNCVSLTSATDGVVNMGNNFAFLTGNYSLSFWVKTSSPTAADTIAVSKHAAGSQNGYLFPIGPTGGGGATDKANFTASSFNSQGVTSTTSVNDNVWHQIVGVYSAGGTHAIYVDGAPAEDTKLSFAMVTSAANFYVGGVGDISNPAIADGRYNGLFDDLQIYNQRLTDAEINYLYANPGSPTPEPAGLALLTTALVPLARRQRPAR